MSVSHVSSKVNATSAQSRDEDREGGAGCHAVINVENSDQLIMYAADTVSIMTVVNYALPSVTFIGESDCTERPLLTFCSQKKDIRAFF